MIYISSEFRDPCVCSVDFKMTAQVTLATRNRYIRYFLPFLSFKPGKTDGQTDEMQ